MPEIVLTQYMDGPQPAVQKTFKSWSGGWLSQRGDLSVVKTEGARGAAAPPPPIFVNPITTGGKIMPPGLLDLPTALGKKEVGCTFRRNEKRFYHYTWLNTNVITVLEKSLLHRNMSFPIRCLHFIALSQGYSQQVSVDKRICPILGMISMSH